MIRKVCIGIIAGLLSLCIFECAVFASEELFSVDNMPGNKISLNFKEADIRSVLRILALKGNINIVAASDVKGNITIRLNDVPWKKALDVILTTYGYAYDRLSDNVIMVLSLKKLAEQRKVQQEAAEIERLDTRAIALNFVKTEDMKTTIEKLVSSRGKFTIEPRTNTLIITDTKSNLGRIDEIIKILDKITPQVMIEAKIIETALGSAEKLGIDWTFKVAASGSKRPTTFPFTSVDKGSGTKIFPRVKVPNELERVETTTTDSIGNVTTSTEEKTWNRLASGFPEVTTDLFTFGTLDFSQFSAVLEVLKSRADTKIVSNPRITTLNNQEAKILVGKVVPLAKYEYSKETGTQIISGYEDKEVGVKLVVVPSVNERDYVTLNVKPSVDEIIGSTGPDGERPIISTRSAQTKVMIKNGQTLVIGGLISEKKITLKKGFPILKDIPIVGFFFGRTAEEAEKTELLIFITPHIVQNAYQQEYSLQEICKLEEIRRIAAKKKQFANRRYF